ncbi:MAG: ABC transporter substrate-binding protein [Gammaproteobacteria bacterium]
MISIVFNRLSLFSLALALVACEPEQKKTITVGIIEWPGYQSLYLARSLGALDRLPVKLIEMPSATETAIAFRNGSLDVAGITLDEALTLLQFVPTLKVILVMDLSLGADVLLAKPEIDSLQKLKNKRVGVENTAVGAVLLHSALQTAGLSIADIKLRSVTFDRHESVFVDGRVDAIVTFEPVKSKLLALGAIKLFDSGAIPGLIIDVLVTRQETIDHHSDILKALVAGHFKALAYLNEHPEDAAARIAPNISVQPDLVLDQFKHLELPDQADTRQLLTGDTPTLVESIASIKTLMLEQGLLFKPVDTRRLIEASLLPPAQNDRAEAP